MSLAISLRAPEGEKSEFIGASALFSISMGEKILMESSCLEKTIAIINATFESCDIVVSDFLQQFNIIQSKPYLSVEMAAQQSLAQGDSWLQRNIKTLSGRIF